MVRIDERTKCTECGSVWSKLIVNEKFHKVLVRVCHDNCSCEGKIIKDYGYSHKMKLKYEITQAQTKDI